MTCSDIIRLMMSSLVLPAAVLLPLHSYRSTSLPESGALKLLRLSGARRQASRICNDR